MFNNLIRRSYLKFRFRKNLKLLNNIKNFNFKKFSKILNILGIKLFNNFKLNKIKIRVSRNLKKKIYLNC